MKARYTVAIVIGTALIAAAALAQQSGQSSSSASGPPATGPGAAVGVTLDGDEGPFTVVTKQPDGTLVTTCVTGSQKAADLVSKDATAPSKTESRALDVR